MEGPPLSGWDPTRALELWYSTWTKPGDLMYETLAQLQEGLKVIRQGQRLKTHSL